MGAVFGDDIHRLGDGKGYGDGFGTAQGGLHFLMDQFDKFGLTVGHNVRWRWSECIEMQM
jgi:hypothetical protein